MNLNKASLAAVFAAFIRASYSYDGDGTFYGGAGAAGACASDYVPAGFKTVAMNQPQYNNGRVCGSCLHACYTANGKEECFDAIVDNLCPECSWGDLDFGWGGSGRWPVTWDYIECPNRDPIIKTEGSNKWYGKVKVMGLGPVVALQLNGIDGTPTADGFFEVFDGSGKFGCGPRVTAQFSSGRKIGQCLSGSLFGGDCPSGNYCEDSNPPPANIQNPAPANPPNPPPPPPLQSTTVAGSKCENGILHSNGEVCCPKSCGSCGGASCATLPGGAENCCASQIRMKSARSCQYNAAPCLVTPEGSLPPPAGTTVAGAWCENGILHSDGQTCCPKSCGGCGGPNCSSLPGGAKNCCSSQIRSQSNRPCATNAAPCLITPPDKDVLPIGGSVAGPWCENGILHPDKQACCPKSCGSCGGANCSALPGGANKCCASQIHLFHNYPCSTNAAPCTLG